MSQNDLVLSHSAAGAFRGKSRRRRRSRAFDGSRLRGEWRPRDRPRFRPTYRRSPTNGMNVFASIYDVGSIGPLVPSYLQTTNLTHLMFPGGAKVVSVGLCGTRADFVESLEEFIHDHISRILYQALCTGFLFCQVAAPIPLPRILPPRLRSPKFKTPTKPSFSIGATGYFWLYQKLKDATTAT